MAKKESYEDMMLKLQNVLLSLEENNLTLDESMKAYEEGTKLVNKLYKVLNTFNLSKETKNFCLFLCFRSKICFILCFVV